MGDYEVRALRPGEMAQMDVLLEREGLRRDARLSYSAGVFDGPRLVAAGSCAGNTLRCLAVERDRQGEGLLNLLVQHLIGVEYGWGNFHMFLYTKPSAVRFFEDLGFSEVVRDDRAVFLENRKTGFSDYLRQLERDTFIPAAAPVGALVMNANPFTLGHRHLVEQASARCGTVHLFVVSEDASEFPAADRELLVREGTAHLRNLVYHRTGSYLISQATFPSYFLKDGEEAARAQAHLDAAVFIRIAQALGISVRFLGTEPTNRTTALYNRVLAGSLPPAGISCEIVPRLERAGVPISASSVRRALKDDRWDVVKSLVPEHTWAYLRSERGRKVLARLKGMEEGRHD